MKYLLICICLIGSQLYAQTTQPTMKKTTTTQATPSAKAPTTQPASRTNIGSIKTTKDAPMIKKANVAEQRNTLMSKEETMAKFGIAESEKNVLGGIIPGGKAPDFSGIDQNGNKIELKELLKEGEVVVIFYRGFWCGLCNQHLSEMEKELSKITDKGARVIAVTTESNEFAKKTVEKNKLSFSVIADTDDKIMKDYKVLYEASEGTQKKIKKYTKSSLQEFNNSDEAFLPIPATYVIDQQGNISWLHYTMDYSNRASVDKIVKALK